LLGFGYEEKTMFERLEKLIRLIKSEKKYQVITVVLVWFFIGSMWEVLKYPDGLFIFFAVIFLISLFMVLSDKDRKKVVKKLRQYFPKKEDQMKAYEIAGEEIKTNKIDEGLWKKAFVDAKGNENRQKALYMKYRAKEVIKSK